ncbi:MAG: ISAs1 family transposase [Treponema sp.]|jgi:predicted transposase YbfD/YdcC|nr:ISAs1 family transposase [Treponema sp.]
MELSEKVVRQMKESLGGVTDPRRQWGAIRHKLIDILVIGLCSIITRGEGFNEMEEVGRARETWFRQFLELPNGIPDEDTFRRVFERINPAELMKCLQTWLCHKSESGGRQIGIDGKTIRGSGKQGEHKAIHMVSAWVNKNSLVLGQLATEEKSNEITAIPQLLNLIDVEGDTITIDAMGCQKEIVKKIREKEADYVIAVKGNQPSLYEEIQGYFEYLDGPETKELPEDLWESGPEKDHGRIEKRRIRTVTDIDFLSGKKDFKDLKTIIECRSERTIGESTSVAFRYYISNKDIPADELGEIIRGHWSIENNLHWSLDISFNEDGCRARKDNSPKNLNILRKVGLFLLRAIDAGKRVSIKRKMLRASLNTDFLQNLLFGK